jgi:hypothetical protein
MLPAVPCKTAAAAADGKSTRSPKQRQNGSSGPDLGETLRTPLNHSLLCPSDEIPHCEEPLSRCGILFVTAWPLPSRCRAFY